MTNPDLQSFTENASKNTFNASHEIALKQIFKRFSLKQNLHDVKGFYLKLLLYTINKKENIKCVLYHEIYMHYYISAEFRGLTVRGLQNSFDLLSFT